MPNLQLKSGKAFLDIYGPIGAAFGGVDAAQVVSDLRSAKGVPIECHINSEGGSCKDGLAIYNRLRDHDAPVHTIVDGAGWSAASIVMLAGDIREVAQGASVMVHNSHSAVAGNKEQLQELVSVLGKVDFEMSSIYADRTNLDVQEASDLMAAETWMTAGEAFDHGFVTVRASRDAAKPFAYNAEIVAMYQHAPASASVAAKKEMGDRERRQFKHIMQRGRDTGDYNRLLPKQVEHIPLAKIHDETGISLPQLDTLLHGVPTWGVNLTRLYLRRISLISESPSYSSLLSAAIDDGIAC